MKDIKFCVNDDGRIAVGVSRWNPDEKPQSDLCRPCYLEQADLVQARVVGPLEITDAVTGVGVGQGGTVTLDPLQTDLAQLVYAGHVEPLPAAKSKATPKAGDTPPKD